MPDYTALLDALTSSFENSGLSISGFYVDHTSSGYKLNVGYGFDITDNLTDPTATENELQDAGILSSDATTRATQWAAILAAAESPPTTAGSDTALNSSLGSGVTVNSTTAAALMNEHYSDVVIPHLSSDLAHYGLNLLSIPPWVALALEDLKYNANHAIYNPSTGTSNVSGLAYALETQNWGAAAYAIQFNANTFGGDAGIIKRRIAEAMYMLGFTPTLDGSHNVTALTPTDTGSVNMGQLINYLKLVADNDEAANFSQLPSTVLDALNLYSMEQGYYVVQPEDVGDTYLDTADNIVANNSIMTVDGAELERLNVGIDGGLQDFTVGGLIHVPMAVDTSISTSSSTSPDNLSSIAASGESYIYDSNVDSSGSDAAYTVAPYISTNGNTIAAGSLSIVINSGVTAAILGPGTWADLYDGVDSDSNAVINIDMTNGSGTIIGTLSIEKNGSGGYYTSGPPGSGSRTTTHLSGGPTIVTSGGPGSGSGSGDGNTGGPSIYDPGGQGYYIDPTTGAMWPITSPGPDGGSTSDGPETGGLVSGFNQSQNTDPIVLDLSGDNAGVQLTSLADSSAYFDLHDSGFAVHTGWVGPTTGILVNTTDPTNITDLFGNSSTNGFAALQALDSNSDGVLNSSDSGFSSLYVWVDANGNGTVDSGEVQSLSSLGITSISLNTSPENEFVNGNEIGDVATFTTSSDTTGQVAEAFFNNSALDSTFSGSYTLNPEVLMLPDLRGYGTLPDLYVAMSMDTTLLGDVAALASDSLSDAATFDAQVTNILYEWAAVSGVDPTSRGDYVNAQDLETLEAVTGQSWVETGGIGDGDTNPEFSALGAGLEGTWNELFTAEKERLLAQGPLASYLSGVTYDYDTDSLTGTTDLSTLATAVGDNVPSESPMAVQYLASMGQFMDQLASDLGISTSEYDSALASDFAAAGLSLSSTSVDDLHYLAGNYDGGDVTYVPDSAGAIATGVTGFTDTLQASDDITQDVITNIPTLDVSGSYLTLNASQLSGFSNVENGYYLNGYTSTSDTLYAAGSGTYDLASATVTGLFDLDASGTSASVTLIGNDQNGQTLTAGSGTDTLEAGNGTGDYLYAGSGTDTLTAGNGGDKLYDGSGVDTLTGGTGNDTFHVSSATSGTTVTGGGGSDTLVASASNISGITVSGVQTLEVGGSYLTLTASQLSGFSNVENQYYLEGYTGTSDTLYAAGSGTYDLASATVTGLFDLDASGTSASVTLIGNDENGQTLTAGSGTDTLEAGDGTGDYLYAGSGTDTLTAGNGGDKLYNGSGADTLTGGTGNDKFYIASATSGTTVAGGGGSDTLIASASNISGITVSGVQTLEVGGSYLTLTASQLSGFSNVENEYYIEGYTGTSDTLYAAGSGTYDLASATVTGLFDLDASGTSASVTLIGNDENGQTLTAGSGTDTLEAGNGTGDYLYAGSGTDTLTAGDGGDKLYDGSGVDTLTGGTGNDTFHISSATSGTTVTGGGGSDTLLASGSNISGITVSGVQTLEVGGSYLTLTASQLSSFSNVENQYYLESYTGTSDTLYAAGSGTYDLASETVTGLFDMDASGTSASVTLIGNDENGQTLTAGSGTDTLTAGNGTGDYLYAGSGNDTLDAGTGNDKFYGGGGTNTYDFGSSFGSDIIYDAGASGSAAGTVAFTSSGTTDENLWFQQSGNDLQIDLLGTSDQITLSNFYSSAGNQVASFTADGLTLDSQLASLVSAMATYSAANSGFNPQTATSMPTDTTLQSAIASSWHS